MNEYTVFASVTQRRSYTVRAENMEEAADMVREDFNWLEFDIIDEDVEDVTVEE